MKNLIFPINSNLWFRLSKIHFHHSYTIIFWNSNKPVSLTYVFLKLSGLLVNIKSMLVAFSGFLKHIGSFIRFCNLYISQNVFREEFSMHFMSSVLSSFLSVFPATSLKLFLIRKQYHPHCRAYSFDVLNYSHYWNYPKKHRRIRNINSTTRNLIQELFS